MKDLIIICAGDFGREIANVIERINAAADEPKWNLLGFVDDDPSLKVHVKECCDLGTGSKGIQGLSIGPNTVIGAGAAVIRDIPADSLAVGVPAKVK